MMKILSSEEYQDRINPWLNKNISIAHCVPVSFPHFRSALVNETFLFVLTIALFLLIYATILLLFSLLGLSNGANIVDNFIATFANSKVLIVFSIFVLIYFRLAYLVFSKLNHELAVKVVGFVAMISIFLIAEGLPTIKALVTGNSTSYPNSIEPGIVIWALVAYALTNKLLRQFREAKSRKAMKAN